MTLRSFLTRVMPDIAELHVSSDDGVVSARYTTAFDIEDVADRVRTEAAYYLAAHPVRLHHCPPGSLQQTVRLLTARQMNS